MRSLLLPVRQIKVFSAILMYLNKFKLSFCILWVYLALLQVHGTGMVLKSHLLGFEEQNYRQAVEDIIID